MSESIPASVRDTLARAMASLPISIKNFLTGCKADVPYMTFTEDLYGRVKDASVEECLSVCGGGGVSMLHGALMRVASDGQETFSILSVALSGEISAREVNTTNWVPLEPSVLTSATAGTTRGENQPQSIRPGPALSHYLRIQLR